MKVKLTLNIGGDDNKRLNLSDTRSGSEVYVSEKVGEVLLKRAWAVRLPDPPPPAEAPKRPVTQAPLEPRVAEAPTKHQSYRGRKTAHSAPGFPPEQ